ncbi:hypothetical protein Q5P01_022249 [Channa striata]|uniref:Uncharacterized protein n=1 Tax=Channa striata TaxID=64152 RepID=A0AA88IWW2_CHASR|nr:hypothetical protein Q5P01_022249 [Channa striata]
MEGVEEEEEEEEGASGCLSQTRSRMKEIKHAQPIGCRHCPREALLKIPSPGSRAPADGGFPLRAERADLTESNRPDEFFTARVFPLRAGHKTKDKFRTVKPEDVGELGVSVCTRGSDLSPCSTTG